MYCWSDDGPRVNPSNSISTVTAAWIALGRADAKCYSAVYTRDGFSMSIESGR